MPQTTVIYSGDISQVRSFSVASVQLKPTLSETSHLSGKLAEVERLTRDLLTEKGFFAATPETSDSVVVVTIQTDVNDTTSKDELRLMKGAHGSRYPSANPRIRDLESDYLELSIIGAKQHQLLYQARCRFSSSEEISLETAKECLGTVVKPL